MNNRNQTTVTLTGFAMNTLLYQLMQQAANEGKLS